MIEITEVRIKKVETGRVKGIATITINDCFVVNDIKIVNGERGLFIAMPSRRVPSGELKDIAHPINSETRELIQSVVLAEYKDKNYSN